MILKGIIDEDITNYKKTSMTLMFPSCTFKCGVDTCQNKDIADIEDIDVSYDEIIDRYMSNDITSAIIFGGLEPFDSFLSLHKLIHSIREVTDDDIVIYSGYTEWELRKVIFTLSQYKNIIIKFGRCILDQVSKKDDVLGVTLVSDNQYAKKIS